MKHGRAIGLVIVVVVVGGICLLLASAYVNALGGMAPR